MSFKILFISHEASATGAPLFLLNFAEWLSQQVAEISIQVLIIKNGELLRAWQQIGKAYALEDFKHLPLPELLKNLCTEAQGFDFVYFNTIETSHILSSFVEHQWFGMKCQSILHAHELEGTVQKYGAHFVKKVAPLATQVIAASKAVYTNLIKNHGFSPHRTEVIYSCARDLTLLTAGEKKISAATPTVIGCGEIAVVKGPDLFVQVCKQVNHSTAVNFQWLGGDTHGILPFLRNDTVKLGLENSCHFVGHQKNIATWFLQADVFFLSSREDSCPLVCLEAASLGLPIVYFQQSGGMDEILGDWAGFPVPYQNIPLAAQTIMQILSNPLEAKKRGEKAREIYQQAHRPEAAYNYLLKKINELKETPCLN